MSHSPKKCCCCCWCRGAGDGLNYKPNPFERICNSTTFFSFKSLEIFFQSDQYLNFVVLFTRVFSAKWACPLQCVACRWSAQLVETRRSAIVILQICTKKEDLPPRPVGKRRLKKFKFLFYFILFYFFFKRLGRFTSEIVSIPDKDIACCHHPCVHVE